MMPTYTDTIKLQDTVREEKAHPYVEVSSTISAIEDDEEARQVHHAQSRPTQHKLLHKVDSWWLWEVAALVIASLSLIAIVALLKSVDQQKVPNWTFTTAALGKPVKTTITINSIISIFSTILKSTVMVPIAASISQLKWLWFCDEEQNLADIQYFEGASKGPLGAAVLLWRLRGRRIVCLGAVIIILTLGLDFAFQSIVSYPLRQVNAGIIDFAPFSQFYDPVPYAPSVPGPQEYFGVPNPEASGDMKNIISAAGFSVNTTFALTPSCSTGNCTWEHSFASLAVCSECHALKITDLNATCTGTDPNSPINPAGTSGRCNYTWQGTARDYSGYPDPFLTTIPGVYFTPSLSYCDSPKSYRNVFIASTYFASPYFETFKRPLSILSTIHANWSDNDSTLNGAYGSQCGLKICVQKYRASMENNYYNETLLETFEDASADYPEPGLGKVANYTLSPPREFFHDMSETAQRTFTITSAAMEGISSFIRDSEQSFWDGVVRQQEGTLNPDPTESFSIRQLRYLSNTWNSSYDGTEHLSQKLTWLASNMTNAIRMHNIKNKITTFDNPNGQSQVQQNSVFVNVRWSWLALPVLELILTILFLLLTVQESAKHKEMGILWKGSALAPFYCPLTKDGREKIGQGETPRQMESVAEELKVQWVKTDHGLRLVHREASGN